MAFKSFFNYCARHSSAYLDMLKQFNELKIKNNDLKQDYKSLNQEYVTVRIQKDTEVVKQQTKEYELKKTLELLRETENKLPKKRTLEDFKLNVFNKLKTYTEYYNYDGTGKKAVNTILELNDKVKDIYFKSLLEEFTSIWTKFRTPDQMVYKFVDWYYHKDYGYMKDIKSHGKLEYWAKPLEALDDELLGRGDCDNTGVVMFTSLFYLLEYYGFKTHQWRLQCMCVLTRTGGGHFILAWLKKNICDWVILETTYFKETFYTSWHEDITFKKNLMYRRILYSFDQKTCRKKLE